MAGDPPQPAKRRLLEDGLALLERHGPVGHGLGLVPPPIPPC